MRKILSLLALLPALAFGQSAQMNLSYLAHQLQSGGIVPLSALQTIASYSVLCNQGGSAAFPSACTSPVLLGLTVNSGTTTLNGGATVASGLTVSSGNFAVNSGTTTLGGNSLVTGTSEVTGACAGAAPDITVANAILCGGNASSGIAEFLLVSPGAGANNRAWIEWADTASSLNFAAINDANSASGQWLKVTRSGAAISAVNFPSGSIQIGGQPLAFGSSGGNPCSIAGTSIYGVTNCVRNSTGNYTINFATASTSNYVCAVASASSNPQFAVVYARTTTSLTYQIYNLSGAPVEGGADFVCY